MKAGYAVDGMFLTQRLTGIQRFAMELLRELDRRVAAGELPPEAFVVCVPASYPRAGEAWPFPCLARIAVGRREGLAWEQLDFARWLKKSGRRGLCLCNTVPVLAPSCAAVIHDISYKVNPQFFRGARARVSRFWHCLQYRVITRRAVQLFTVSRFSQAELGRVYGVEAEKVPVVYNAWQHLAEAAKENLAGRAHAFAPGIPADAVRAAQEGGYWFAMATVMPNKNFAWILRAAQANPAESFVVAGGGDLAAVAAELGFAHPDNVYFLGYTRDEDIPWLMANCKAFVFPTFYEGFGIPPLEAAACGAPGLLLSDTPCMHEIFGEAAAYLDPKDRAPRLGEPPQLGQAARAELLARYSWKKSADAMLAYL